MVRRYTDSEYIFTPGASGVGTVRLPNETTVELGGFALIVNVTDGIIIFNPRIPGQTGTVATDILTLAFDTSGMSNTDDLLVVYDDPALTSNTTNLATELSLLNAVTALQIIDDWDEANRAAVNLIAGQVAISAGAGAVAANTPRMTLASDDPAVASLATIDDWDESDRAKVNPVVGQAGVAAGAGAVTANTQRVTHASDDPVTTSLQLIDDTVATDGAATPTKSVSIAGTDGTNAQTLKTDAAGELQVDVLTHPALSENTDAVTIYGSDDGGVTKRVIQTDANGQIQVDINTSTLNVETTQVLVKNAVEIMDDWDESDRAKVNPIVGQAGVQAGAGAVSANTQRVTLASDDPGVTSLQLLDDTVSTTGSATPAKGILVTGTDGTNARGIKTDASGELQVDVLTQPARAATTDSISSKDSTDVIQNGLVALTPKFAIIDASTSGDNTLLAAVASKKIRVISLYLVASAAVTARFESGAGGTALSGQMQLAANGGFVLPYNPVGWFETASNTLLNLELSSAVSVDGGFTYIEV